MEAVEGRYRQYVEHAEAQIYKVEIIEYGVEGGVAGFACHHQAKKYEHGNKKPARGSWPRLPEILLSHPFLGA